MIRVTKAVFLYEIFCNWRVVFLFIVTCDTLRQTAEMLARP